VTIGIQIVVVRIEGSLLLSRKVQAAVLALPLLLHLQTVVVTVAEVTALVNSKPSVLLVSFVQKLVSVEVG